MILHTTSSALLKACSGTIYALGKGKMRNRAMGRNQVKALWGLARNLDEAKSKGLPSLVEGSPILSG